MAGERLQKFLARAGYGSRRSAEALIQAGRVAVNGEIAHLGQRVTPDQDRVEVDGSPVGREPLQYLLLNKPAGVVTTRKDPGGRRTVMDLLPPGFSHLHPAGRLDRDSEGLLLLTNDGPLTFFLTHPRHQVPKTYLALVQGEPDAGTLRRLQRGVKLEEGRARAEQAEIAGHEGSYIWLRLVLREGRKRQVRRMCEAVGHPVARLLRVEMGPLRLGSLEPGHYRELTAEELQALRSWQNSRWGEASRQRG